MWSADKLLSAVGLQKLADKRRKLVSGYPELHGDMVLRAPGSFDARLRGGISSAYDLQLSSQAEVTGPVTGNDVVVAGQLQGDLTATGWVRLKEKSRVEAKIKGQAFELEPGAVFRGAVAIGSDSAEQLNVKLKRSA